MARSKQGASRVGKRRSGRVRARDGERNNENAAPSNGVAEQVQDILAVLTKPGPIEPDAVRKMLIELQPLVATKEGATAFVEGPGGNAGRGGLRWLVCTITRHAASEKAGGNSNPYMVLGILQFAQRMIEAEGGITPQQLASQPWGTTDVHAPTSIIAPLVELARVHCAGKGLVGNAGLGVGFGRQLVHSELSLLVELAADEAVARRLVQAGVLVALSPLWRDFDLPPASPAVVDCPPPEAKKFLHCITALLPMMKHTDWTMRNLLARSGLPEALLSVVDFANTGIPNDGAELDMPQLALSSCAGSAMLCINNMTVGCEDMKKAFAGVQPRAVHVLLDSMEMPAATCPARGNYYAKQGCAALALHNLSQYGPLRSEAVSVGAVQTAVALLQAPSSEAAASSGDAVQQEDDACLLAAAVMLLGALSEDAAGEEQVRGSSELRVALQQLQQGNRHCAEFVEEVLAPLVEAAGLQEVGRQEKQPREEASLKDEEEGCEGVREGGSGITGRKGSTLAARAVVTQRALERVRNPVHSTATSYRPVPKTRAELQEDAVVDPDARSHLSILGLVEHAYGSLEWGDKSKEEGYCKWVGTSPELPSGCIILFEYPIGGQVGSTGKAFEEGAMGYDAAYTGPGVPDGALLLPRELARDLLLSAKLSTMDL